MRRVPRLQPLQFPPSADITAATQLLIRSIRDALSGMFDVADPTGTVTLTSPVWVPGWHAPLLKLTKAAISPNRDDTHDLHRLIDDLFSQLQERLTSAALAVRTPSGLSWPVSLTTSIARRVELPWQLFRISAFAPERPLQATCELYGLS